MWVKIAGIAGAVICFGLGMYYGAPEYGNALAGVLIGAVFGNALAKKD